MKVIYGSEFFNHSAYGVMTLGVFDGLHRGHQKIIQRVVQSAQDLKTSSILYTMDPHPSELLNKKVKRLFPLKQMISQASKWGLDFFIIENFSKDFSQISSFDFVKNYIYKQLHPQKIIIGEDFRFGLNREGGVSDLIQWGKQFSFQVEAIPPLKWEGQTISSTWVRQAYQQSQMNQLKNLLGRAFSVKGEVVSGKGLGTKLGFPTANIKLESEISPQKGVYTCQLRCFDKTYFGVMNWGVCPTLSDSNTPQIEVHILNPPQKDLKGQKVDVEILSYIRDEQKFDSSHQLRQAIQADVKKAERYFYSQNS